MDYVADFEKNVNSRLLDIHIESDNLVYDLRPTSLFLGVIIGTLISRIGNLYRQPLF